MAFRTFSANKEFDKPEVELNKEAMKVMYLMCRNSGTFYKIKIGLVGNIT
jgi:hypothetical protein